VSLKDKLIQLSKIFSSGFTVNIDNGIISQFNKKSGYIVSYKTLLTINNDKVTIINSIPNKAILGGWRDKDTNIYYIEVNKVFNTLNQALNNAKELNQKAIWDISNNKEIEV